MNFLIWKIWILVNKLDLNIYLENRFSEIKLYILFYIPNAIEDQGIILL